MKILVCGGRDYQDIETMTAILDELNAKQTISLVINGDARGADKNSTLWANQRRIPTKLYPAKWNLYGKSAGYKRNLEMLLDSKPDLVVCFPGGKGTAMMKALAEQHKYKVLDFQ